MLPVIRGFLAMHWLHESLCHLKLLDWFWIFGEWVWRYKFQIWEWTFARNETNTILRDKMVGAQFQIHWFVKDCRKEDSRTTLPHKSRAKRVQWITDELYKLMGVLNALKAKQNLLSICLGWFLTFIFP